jgi:putative endopeptidase
MQFRLIKPLALAIACACAGNAFAATEPLRGLDIKGIDDKAPICDSLNAHMNGIWAKNVQIPADRTTWGSFEMLGELSLERTHGLVEDASKAADKAAAGSVEQKLGWYYRTGMDDAAINKAGITPIADELKRIDGLKTPDDIVGYLQDSHAKGFGQVFSFGGESDFKNSSMTIAYAGQDGLGLPERAYYLEDGKDGSYKKIRDAYVAHIAKQLQAAGTKPADAAAQAKQILSFETRLATASLAPVELRNPENQYNFVSVVDAEKVTPHFSWAKFFAANGADSKNGFSLSQPKFFAEFDKMLTEVPADQWSAYLRFHAIDGAAPYLSDALAAEQFDFYGKTLRGAKEMRPRWKRVLGSLEDSMGLAVGEQYVKQYFPPEAKQRADELVQNLRVALKARLEHLDWMSPETKKLALEKWASFVPKIGYPDKWRDWSGLSIKNDNYFTNVAAAAKFNHDWNAAKIGKPVDRSEWGMTPQTVNAQYNPLNNDITFPAAILQPPFFDAKADDALNYGGIGTVIGHEMMHGYDDEGAQFDAKGNYKNWWSDEDKKKFEERTARLVKQFDDYVAIEGLHVKGQLTLGENIADLGGINIAYDALQMALKKNPDEAGKKIDGFTENQRFFMNFGQIWRRTFRPEELKLRLNTDPHAPSFFRAIGAPSNMPAFAEAFSCKAGSGMVRVGEKQVVIW